MSLTYITTWRQPMQFGLAGHAESFSQTSFRGSSTENVGASRLVIANNASHLRNKEVTRLQRDI
jgi:hypothetical protein